MSEVLLQASGVTAGYGLVPAIQNVDLTIRAGEVVTLLGPNGAGKTTTLLALTGLLPIAEGTARALDIEVKAGRTNQLSKAGLILVPDDRGVFPDLTVGEHFRLVDGRVRRQRMDRIMETFPALVKLTGRRAGLLSGGEQQMLAIAKSLLAKPRILMVDEMSLGLAPIIVQEMLPGLAGLAREEGFGVLLVEQHVAIALSVSDRALVLNQGRSVLEDSAAALLADPSRVEAAYFGAVRA